ncbi:Lsr2 dimerization domain-containing protein [Streptomyces sp. NPDC001089]
MAKEVRMYDDLDGGDADETVPFSLDGRFYELDLNKANAAAFRRMLDSYIKQARPAQAPGGILLYLPAGQQRAAEQFGAHPFQELALAVAGTNQPTAFLPSTTHTERPTFQLHTNDHTPRVPEQPADNALPDTATPQPEPAAQPNKAATATPDAEVRAWAKIWSVPCPPRGRVPSATHEVYAAFQADDLGPWKAVLRANGTGIKKAKERAEELLKAAAEAEEAANNATAATPTREELDHKQAAYIRTLPSAQLDRLRAMFNAPDGRATSTGISGDNASFNALASRHLCAKVAEDGRKVTYEITSIGRVWFEVRGIPTRAEND